MSKNKSKANQVIRDTSQRRTLAVGGYVVSEATMREAIRRVNMAQNAEKYIAAHPTDDELPTMLSVYPHIAGCASPIMSIDDYLQMTEQEVDALAQAAIELNPHWFPQPDQEKKTDEQPQLSTSELTTL